MALNTQVGEIVCPAATGNQTTNLPFGFDPKAIIFWTSGRTAVGGAGTHARWSYGVASDRGGTAAQRWVMYVSEDSIASSDVYPGGGSASVVKLTNGTDATVVMAASFVEFGMEVPSLVQPSIVLNWATVSSGVIVNYMVLGGSDVEDALASNIDTEGVTNQDVSIGFQPSLVFFLLSWNGGETPSTNDGDTCIGWGRRRSVANGRCIRWGAEDASATMLVNQAIHNDRALAIGNRGAIDWAFQLSGSAAWPTDGFEITWITPSGGVSGGWDVPFLAIKFSADVTVNDGEGTAPTTGSLPVVQTLASAGTPKLMMNFHVRHTTANVVDTTTANCMELAVGAVDGAGTERVAGIADDDANANGNTAVFQNDAKAVEVWTASGPSFDGTADGIVNGSNFDLSWDDLPSAAVLYEWLTVGIAAAGGAALSGSSDTAGSSTGDLTASPHLSGTSDGAGTTGGALAASPQLTGTSDGASSTSGTLTVPASLSGSSAASGTSAGTLAAAAQLSGSSAGAGAASGALAASALLTGASSGAAASSGTLSAATHLTGSSAGAGSTSGALTATPQLSGSSAGAGTATGNLSVPGTAALSGASVGTGTSSGSLIVAAPLSGSSTAAGTSTGTLSVPSAAVLTGTSSGAGTSSGSLITSASISASSTVAGASIGTLTVPDVAALSGASSVAATATGALTARVMLTGASMGAGTSAGLLAVVAPLSGASTAAGTSTGDVTAGLLASVRPADSFGGGSSFDASGGGSSFDFAASAGTLLGSR